MRSTRSSGIANGAPADLDEQRGHDRQRQRQADLRRSCRRPARRSSATSPPSSRIVVRTASMPTPRPEMSLRDLGGREAGGEQQLGGARGVDRATASSAISPRSTALRGDARGVDPAAVVAHGDDDVAAGVAGGDLERAGRRLAGGDALLGRLEAVVERVADEVDERVAERVDDRAVELGVLADEPQLDLLAELGGEVAHQPREAQEDGLDRDHADLHDHRLQRLRGAREVLHRLREPGHVGVGGERLDVRAVHDELAHEVHELVEPLGVDADGGGALEGARPAGAGRGRPATASRIACSATAGRRRALLAATSTASASATSGTCRRRRDSALVLGVGDQPGLDRGRRRSSTSSGAGPQATVSPCSPSARAP